MGRVFPKTFYYMATLLAHCLTLIKKKDSTYHWSLRHLTQVSNSLLQQFDTVLLALNVDLTTDAVDFWVETQRDAKSLGKVIGQRWLAQRIYALYAATIENDLDGYVSLCEMSNIGFIIRFTNT